MSNEIRNRHYLQKYLGLINHHIGGRSSISLLLKCKYAAERVEVQNDLWSIEKDINMKCKYHPCIQDCTCAMTFNQKPESPMLSSPGGTIYYYVFVWGTWMRYYAQ